MSPFSGTAAAVSRARPAAGRAAVQAADLAWRGLVRVLIGTDPAPTWRRPWLRRAVHAGLAIATLLTCAVSAICLRGVSVQLFGQASFISARVGPHVHVVNVWLPLDLGWPVGPMALAVLIAVAVVAPLPLTARYPLMGWRLGWLALLFVPRAGAIWLGGWAWDPVQLLVLVVAFCVAGVRQPRPVLCWMWALTLVAWLLQAGTGGPGLLGGALGAAVFTAVAIAADGLGSRRRAQLALAGQAEQTELEQARRAVLEERAKIARELHDVVAHHMSLIAVRAETAPYRLAGLTGPVRAEFGSLSGAARDALADMRRLLGVLRDDRPAERSPQPGLPDLPTLVETAREAGVAVRLSMPDAPDALGGVPAAVGVCGYRIVQESLSNAGRHAPGTPVTVSVDQEGGALLLRVANGPAGPAPPAGNGQRPGHGLAGMRERVTLLGGSLTAGPAPGGGFVVSAVLPLGGSVPAPAVPWSAA